MSLDLPFLSSFFRAVSDRPIEFDDGEPALYVRLYDSPSLAPYDPVKWLARPIEFDLSGSTQLLSGSRGSGKSTELRRLRQQLIRQGYKAVLCDMEDYLDLSQRVEVNEFLMALAKAFGAGLSAQGYLPASLIGKPSGTLGSEAHLYISACLDRLKEKFGPDTKPVLLVDSMEHIRGSLANAESVLDSVIRLFGSHSDRLQFDGLHVVYTIPSYLAVLSKNLGFLYSGGIVELAALRLHTQKRAEVFQPGLDLMEQVISRRGNWRTLLGEDRRVLDHLSTLSGGHLRSFLRLFAEIIRRAEGLPVHPETIEAAISQVRSGFLPIAGKDASWLAQIASTGGVALPDTGKLHDLARYLDTPLVLRYRSGARGYDVHPLIRDTVLSQAGVLKPEARSSLPGSQAAPFPITHGPGIEFLEISGIEAVPEARFVLAPRLNLLAGDNSTGKTFVLDLLWWALTNTWASAPVWPGVPREQAHKPPTIIAGARDAPDSISHFDATLERWIRPTPWRTASSLVLYARVDGSFSIWDPIRDMAAPERASREVPSHYQFSPQQLWEGLIAPGGTVLCNGLIRDWLDWQHRRKDLFDTFQRALEGLSLQEENLRPGAPVRLSMHEALDIPTLEMSYGTVPVIHASAAVKRILGLAYLLVWSWSEHREACRLSGQPPAERIVLLIDEVESHLHPKWQRLILPALLRVTERLSENRQVQVVCSTHAPLVMASLEPLFDPGQDKVFRFELQDGRIEVQEQPWASQGDVVNWLVSETFGLKQGRSREAEEAIEAAEAFMRGEASPGFESPEKIDARLRQVLPGHDPFWPTWYVATGRVR